jgi:hypothetical protein
MIFLIEGILSVNRNAQFQLSTARHPRHLLDNFKHLVMIIIPHFFGCIQLLVQIPLVPPHRRMRREEQREGGGVRHQQGGLFSPRVSLPTNVSHSVECGHDWTSFSSKSTSGLTENLRFQLLQFYISVFESNVYRSIGLFWCFGRTIPTFQGKTSRHLVLDNFKHLFFE